METGQMKAANVEGGFPVREGGAGKVVNERRCARALSSECLLRLLAVLATLVAAVVVGLDKETQIIPFTLVPNMPPIQVTLPAKWHYVSALKYFVVVNAMACAYSALSLLLSMVGKLQQVSLELGLLFLDLIVLVFLSTATGAAAAVSLLASRGNSHVNWQKICNVYTKFCRQAGAAIAVSILAPLFFVTLILLSVLNIRRRCR